MNIQEYDLCLVSILHLLWDFLLAYSDRHTVISVEVPLREWPFAVSSQSCSIHIYFQKSLDEFRAEFPSVVVGRSRLAKEPHLKNVGV